MARIVAVADNPQDGDAIVVGAMFTDGMDG